MHPHTTFTPAQTNKNENKDGTLFEIVLSRKRIVRSEGILQNRNVFVPLAPNLASIMIKPTLQGMPTPPSSWLEHFYFHKVVCVPMYMFTTSPGLNCRLERARAPIYLYSFHFLFFPFVVGDRSGWKLTKITTEHDWRRLTNNCWRLCFSCPLVSHSWTLSFRSNDAGTKTEALQIETKTGSTAETGSFKLLRHQIWT